MYACDVGRESTPSMVIGISSLVAKEQIEIFSTHANHNCSGDAHLRLIERFRQAIPGVAIRTTLIVGFPGESDDEWKQGLEIIESIGFSHIHIFSYSPRPGTKAAGLPQQVPAQIKKRRSKQLHALAENMRSAALKRHLGSTFSILWEGKTKPRNSKFTEYSGYTPNYLKVEVAVPDDIRLGNKIQDARLVSLSDDGNSAIAKLA